MLTWAFAVTGQFGSHSVMGKGAIISCHIAEAAFWLDVRDRLEGGHWKLARVSIPRLPGR